MLSLRRRKKAVFSAELIAAARVVRVGGRETDGYGVLNPDWDRINLLALEARDPIVANTIARDASSSREVLVALSSQYEFLDIESRQALLTDMMQRDITDERFFLEVSRTELSHIMLTIVVAGLIGADARGKP